MRLLAAYDGSEGADAALDGLARAGLPPDAEACVLAVAQAEVAAARPRRLARTAFDVPAPRAEERAAEALAAARSTAARGAARLAAAFPGWTVEHDACGGSASTGILLKADAWRADLVVVGSRGRARPVRLVLGSVARRVAAEARCCVRVGRASAAEAGGPFRIVVGHDGGESGRAALEAAAQRGWPAPCEIRVVAVDDVRTYTVFAAETPWPVWPVPERAVDRGAIRAAMERDAARAQRDGVVVTAEILSGVPAGTLVRTARKWRADCVFVGATSHGRVDRFLLGSVSSAVADRASCSVEIVRPRPASAPE